MSRRIGNRNEEKVCWWYKHEGYTVWMPTWGGRGHGRFRSTDAFEVFDVLATCMNEMIFAQVKTEKTFRTKVEEEIKAIPMPSNIKKAYWTIREDYAHVREYIQDICTDEYKIDLIKMEVM